MIYVDSSVLLSSLFSEKLAPPDSFWHQALVSSRLIAYETLNRMHARGLSEPHLSQARNAINGIQLVDMSPASLVRALSLFPVQARTLDSLHLATIVYLQGRGQTIELATYDKRLAAAAQAIGIAIVAM